MADWRAWSDGWLREGYYLSYQREGTTIYEYVSRRDWAHYVYAWPETVAAGSVSSEKIPDTLELTRGYDETTTLNNIWQIIFGIKGQAYIYVQLPADLKRHGTAKTPWHSSDLREVAHFEEYMSPYHEPSFVTEHFLIRPETYRISLDAYNPQSIDLTDLRLNFIIAKLVTERVGTEEYGELSTPVVKGAPEKTTRLRAKWEDVLSKLYKKQIPCRPITILPVRLPAEAPSGE